MPSATERVDMATAKKGGDGDEGGGDGDGYSDGQWKFGGENLFIGVFFWLVGILDPQWHYGPH